MPALFVLDPWFPRLQRALCARSSRTGRSFWLSGTPTQDMFTSGQHQFSRTWRICARAWLDYLTGNVKAVPEARFLFVSRGLLSGNCFKNLRLSMQGWWPWFMWFICALRVYPTPRMHRWTSFLPDIRVCLSSLNTNPQPFEDAESATGKDIIQWWNSLSVSDHQCWLREC